MSPQDKTVLILYFNLAFIVIAITLILILK